MLMNQIRILIANKYFLTNYAIRCILQKIKNFDVHGVAENEVLLEIKRCKPDLLVIEIEILKMNSFELLSEIKEKYPRLKIMVLLDIDNKEKLLRILKFQLDGYLLKNTSREELILAANCIHKGERYFSKEIHHYILENLTALNGSTDKIDFSELLSGREKEILHLIAADKNNHEIAKQLFISPNTVLTHRRNIMRKLKVKSTPQLIITSFKHGLITLKD